MNNPVTAEYKFGKAVVRVHGEPDMENFKTATVQFMKKVREEQERDIYGRTNGVDK